MKDISGLLEVKRHSPLPIAADESVFDKYDLENVLYLQAADDSYTFSEAKECTVKSVSR